MVFTLIFYIRSNSFSFYSLKRKIMYFHQAGVCFYLPYYSFILYACIYLYTSLQANVLGSICPTRAVLPYMKDQRSGSIVFVSSQAGQVGIWGYSAYSASKFALRGLAQALQMEVLPDPFSLPPSLLPSSPPLFTLRSSRSPST